MIAPEEIVGVMLYLWGENRLIALEMVCVMEDVGAFLWSDDLDQSTYFLKSVGP